MQIELEVDRYLLVGEVVEVDDSFDHEFGYRRLTGVDVKDFAIISYNDNLEHDVTKAYIGTKIYDYYLEKLLNYAFKIYEVA